MYIAYFTLHDNQRNKTENNMRNCNDRLLSLLTCAIRGESGQHVLAAPVSEEEIRAIFDLAKKHDLTHLIGAALETTEPQDKKRYKPFLFAIIELSVIIGSYGHELVCRNIGVEDDLVALKVSRATDEFCALIFLVKRDDGVENRVGEAVEERDRGRFFILCREAIEVGSLGGVNRQCGTRNIFDGIFQCDLQNNRQCRRHKDIPYP